MSRDSLSERAGTSRAHARANTLSMLQGQPRKVAHVRRALHPFTLTGISQKPPNSAPPARVSGPDTRRACPGVGGSRWRARSWGARKVRNSGFSKPCFWGALARFLSVFGEYVIDVSRTVSPASSQETHRSPATAVHANEQRLAHNGTLWVRDLGSANGVFVNGLLETQAHLMPGDRLTVGETSFLVEYDLHPPKCYEDVLP
jgi:hypothetical protein